MLAEGKATEITKRRFNRNAPFYDLMEGLMMGPRGSQWRQLLWSRVEGAHILELGVGTGKNFAYYPAGADIIAIDFSGRMLNRARDKASREKVKVHLGQMDVENLEFEDGTFDTVVASFVFCSVPNPLRGLVEVERVSKAGGKVVLLEHVLSANRIAGWLMKLVNPLVVRMSGANINRRTMENVVKSGLVVEQVTDLGFGIIKLIEARKKAQPQ